MHKHPLFLPVILAAAILLAGCSLPTQMAAVQSANTPLSWIDAPLDGSHLPLGNVEVVTHASAADQVSAIRLLVDQQVVGEKAPDDSSSGLALAYFVWAADTPGEHLLQAEAQGADGSWGSLTSAVITIGETSPDTRSEVTESPTATATPTPTTAARSTPTSTPTEAAACTNLAGFVSETVPDDTQFSPGDIFTKTWTLENRGTCTWDSTYSLVFVDGRQMGGASPTPLTVTVPPGEQVTLTVDLQAPNNTNTYRGNWMLSDGDGNLFGLGSSGQTAFWVRIEVVQSIIIIPGIIDIQAPTISVDYAPKGTGVPNEDQQITFTATASDNIGVTLIEIYFSPSNARTPALVGSCSNTEVCVITAGPYTSKTYSLIAKAYDAAGNEASTSPQTVIVIQVVR
jgi:hypothetical protein